MATIFLLHTTISKNEEGINVLRVHNLEIILLNVGTKGSLKEVLVGGALEEVRK